MSIRHIATTQQKVWKSQTTQPVAKKNDANLVISNERFQSWEGFGGCFNELGQIALSLLTASEQKQVMTALFDNKDGCGLTMCRMPMGASDYAKDWFSYNENAGDFDMKKFSIERDKEYLIPYINAARKIQPNLQLFASPWSPPTWMKDPGVYNYGKFIMEKKYLDAYAKYFVKFVKAYQAMGMPVTQVHPQNEPVADQKFPSCLWSGEQLKVFIRDHLGPAFKKEKLDCEVWLGTLNTADYNGYPNAVLSDAKAREFVAGVGFQWDGKFAVQRTAQAWPSVRLMQTENECGDGKNSWEYAHYIFDLFRHYITNGVNAYCYWNMILKPTGRSTWGWLQNSMITIDPATKKAVYNPEFYVMKHYARFIKPGAVRLGVDGSCASNAVAFENVDGSIVSVVSNPLTTAHTAAISLQGQATTITMEPMSFHTLIFSGK